MGTQVVSGELAVGTDQNSNQDSVPLSSQELVCGHLYAPSSSLHIGDQLVAPPALQCS